MSAEAVLARFGVTGPPLGEGAEAWVHALDDARVLRVAKDPSPGGWAGRGMLLADLAPGAAAAGVPIPEVMETGEVGGWPFAVERRIPGTDMGRALRLTPDRGALIAAYMKMAHRLGDVATGADYRELGIAPPLVAATGPGLLEALARRSLGWAGRSVAPVVPEWLDGPPALVHLDYFPGNVMVEGTRITGVIDLGFGTILADRRLTPAVAALSLRFRSDATTAELAQAEALSGLDAGQLDDVRRWLAAFWSFAIADDAELARWAAPVLER